MERIRKSGCELFVPKVKNGRDCQMCGFSLLEHSLIIPQRDHSSTFAPITSHSHATSGDNCCSNSYNLFANENEDMKTDFSASSNSAFSQYRKLPLLSPTNNTSLSSSPVAALRLAALRSPLPSSPKQTKQILRPKPVHQRKSYAFGDTLPSNFNFTSNSNTNLSGINQHLNASQSSPNYNLPRSSSNTEANVLQKNQVIRGTNFKDILNRFQSAAQDNSFSRNYSLRYPGTAHTLPTLQDVQLSSSPVIIGSPTIINKLRTPRSSRGYTLGGAKLTSSNIPSPEYYQQLSPLHPNNTTSDQELTQDNNNLPSLHKELDLESGRERSINQIVEYLSPANFTNMNSLTSPSPSSNTQSFQRRNSYSRGPTPRTNYQSSNYASPGQNNDVYLSPRSDLNTISPSRRTSRKDNSDSDSMPPRGSRHLSLTPSSPNLILTKNPNIRSESTFARRRSVKSGQQEDARHSPKMKITSVTSYTPNSRPPSINNHYQNNDYNSGSDSGIRENSDCVSPRSPDYKLSSDVVPSKNVYTQTQAYSQIVSSQVTTLAMVAENFAELSLSAYPEQRKISKDFLSRLSFYQINFKYSSPVIIKGSILISDAEISTGYGKGDIRVSVMITPAAHYSPLMGRHAEVSGFGPVILTEFEESQQAVSGFLNSCGVYSKQASAYKITLMPAQICCSFHTLSAQFLHYSSKSINPSKYEEHVCFIVLQLLTALKYLQSDGVEMLSSNFREFLITYHHSDLTECLQTFDHLPRLFLLKEAIGNNDEEGMSVGMCKYATRALYTLLNHKMHSSLPLILERSEFSYPLKKCAELLSMDKSSSLSEAKSVLELAFFVGPTQFNSENEAKIWLDTNRANLLNRVLFLMMSKKENFLDLKEKMHIQFLLSSTPRNLCQSLRLLSKHNTTPPLQDSEC